MLHYDLIVLGSGNAGMAAASAVRAAGKSVAVVEKGEFGGTCPIKGCVPKKVLVAAAEVLHEIKNASQHHIRVQGTEIDWASLIERKQSFVEGVSEDFSRSLTAKGIDLYEGIAKFVGPRTISAGSHTLSAEAIVIATGSRPRPLAIKGGERTITSDDLLNLDSLPESLIAIGGGVIALEFAHVLARAGTRVTVLESTSTLLPRFDMDLVQVLTQECERIGITVITGVQVTEISKHGSAFEVHFNEHDGTTRILSAQTILNGTGRIPDIDELELDAAEIEHDGSRIVVDDYLRSTSNPKVFVAGDALWSSAQLSPLATYEGNIVGRNIAQGPLQRPDYRTVPSAVFTIPPLVTVGLTESQAKNDGLDYTVKVNDMTGWRSARMHAETVAFSKVLLEKDKDRILGAHLIGHGGDEIIHLFSLAMRHEISATKLKEQFIVYPTYSSDIKYMI